MGQRAQYAGHGAVAHAGQGRVVEVEALAAVVRVACKGVLVQPRRRPGPSVAPG